MVVFNLERKHMKSSTAAIAAAVEMTDNSFSVSEFGRNKEQHGTSKRWGLLPALFLYAERLLSSNEHLVWFDYAAAAFFLFFFLAKDSAAVNTDT